VREKRRRRRRRGDKNNTGNKITPFLQIRLGMANANE
jgi:hypothetical protein